MVVGVTLGIIAGIVGIVQAAMGATPWLLLGYSFGFAFGVWFILGQLMAVYLPRGSLINLF